MYIEITGMMLFLRFEIFEFFEIFLKNFRVKNFGFGNLVAMAESEGGVGAVLGGVGLRNGRAFWKRKNRALGICNCQCLEI